MKSFAKPRPDPQPAAAPARGAARVLAALRQTPALAGMALVRCYQLTLSSVLGRQCRYLPTCSAYAMESIGRFGLWAGGWMALARVCRCHPWGGHGLDYPPLRRPPAARWWAPWRYGLWRGQRETQEGPPRPRLVCDPPDQQPPS
ncbi:membrane protein insertion efficiency factor YidD [Camelimonas abortus]